MKSKIKDLCKMIGSGGTPSRRNKSYYFNGKVKWLKTKELLDNKIYDTEENITKIALKNSSAKVYPVNTVSMAMYGATVGQLGIFKTPMATNQACCNMVVDEKKADYRFLYYSLLNNRKELKGLANGAAQQNLNKSIIENFVIDFYGLEEQKAIADTLSSLDDKIELNNKINENLEQQAQVIFKHWFVDFEFSNEEGKPYKSSGGEMVESELGLIPKGWNIDKLGKNKLGNLVRSGIKEFSGEKIYFATADVSDSYIVNEEVKITIEERPSRANMQPKPNTVWFAKMKDSRKLILVDELDYELQKNYIFSTGFAGLQASKDSVCYLWTYLQSERFDITKNSLCTGTTMQSINNSNINRMKIVIPPNDILISYNQIVRPMFRKIVNNRYENRTLAKLRDTLLPKLMSGEIRIPLD